jgi:hypothetical protein
MSTLEKLLQQPLPDQLYHYTSQEGLRGIVQGGELWASKITHLNDSSELALTLSTTRTYVEGTDLPNRVRAGILRDLELIDASANNVFVFSLTSNGDQLSQWRGYTQPGSGYSIGFAAAELKRIAEQDGLFSLGPCSYSADVREEVVGDLVSRVVSRNLHLCTKRKKYTPRTRWRTPQFRDELLFAASFLKHEAFREEEEWRLVSRTIPYKDSRFCYRSGKSHLLPYFRLSIRGTPGSIPLRSITVGPTPHPDLALSAVEGLLLSAGINEFSMQRSRIPFRQW